MALLNLTQLTVCSLERATGIASEPWTRNIPRNTEILVWADKLNLPESHSPSEGHSIVFATFQHAPGVDDYQDEAWAALERLERMILTEDKLSKAVSLFLDSKQDQKAIPEPPPELKNLEYRTNTITVQNMQQNVFGCIRKLSGIDPQLPEWWSDASMPQDAEIVVAFVRDGQAVQPFDKAEIPGVLVSNPSERAVRAWEVLELFCRYITDKSQQYFLHDFLEFGDIQMLKRDITQDDVFTLGQPSYDWHPFEGSALRDWHEVAQTQL